MEIDPTHTGVAVEACPLPPPAGGPGQGQGLFVCLEEKP